jgi:hypothetical protein
MLFLRPFVQVDKNDAFFLALCYLFNLSLIYLYRQTKTEISSAGEQLIRVKFD